MKMKKYGGASTGNALGKGQGTSPSETAGCFKFKAHNSVRQEVGNTTMLLYFGLKIASQENYVFSVYIAEANT